MDPTYLKQPGGHVLVADAPNWTGDERPHLIIGVSFERIRNLAGMGLRNTLGQMYGVLVPGLIFTQHLFQGLRRGMHVGDDADAAGSKLAATWKAERDGRLVGPAQDARIEFTNAPEGRVFAVYISLNGMITEFPDIYGWAEHWAWLAADAATPGAPVDWQTRYDARLWSAPQAGAR